jgi:Tol biopolymer transport system component
MALPAGTRLGSYEILEPLGAGGMGEVYRAHDPRLKRDVALKVLPAELASEPERLGRFQREAETLAALNHPHIVTIFSVEKAEEHRFLTMELVEGKTLTKVIPRGGLPLSRLFPIAIPLAEAVSAAHEKGIVHRDLKPGNVMVTEEDRVKVLDFGLAKLREGAPGAVDTQSPTEPATGPGRVLGTALYMSPEQVQGKALDHRSDVFALGIILYEMATGERPFGGETFADVASSILKDTPASVTERRADLPRDLAKLIKHCLEKEPRKRFQSTLDLANELEELRREVDSGEALTSGGAPVATRRAGGRRRVWLVSGAVVATLVVGYFVSTFVARPPAEAQLEPIEIAPLTTDGGWKASPELSPDGQMVAYEWIAPGSTGQSSDIYVQAVGPGTRPVRLTEHQASDRSPAWSPDGRQIAFVRALEEGAAIYLIPSLGGQERRVYESPELRGYRLSWSPDGQWLAFSERSTEEEPYRIVGLSLDSLATRTFSSRSAKLPGDKEPSFSPDGSQIAFVRSTGGDFVFGEQDVWVQPVEGGEARRLTSRSYEHCYAPVWTQDGREVLFTQRTADWHILRVSLEGGEPRPLGGVGASARSPSIGGGRMVYVQLDVGSKDIWRVPGRSASRLDRTPERLIVSSQDDNLGAYSPDGKKIAFQSYRSGGVGNIWACKSDGSDPRQLTSFEGHSGSPDWSPDSRRIAFDSAEAGDFNIYVIDAEGGIPLRLTREPSKDAVPSWSRDGRWIYFSSDRSGSQQIWKIPAEGGSAVQVTRSGGIFGQESWDGRHLYYVESAPGGVWRVPTTGGKAVPVLSELIFWFNLAVVEDGLYFAPSLRSPYTIQFLDFDSRQTTEVFRADDTSFRGGIRISPDEEWILFSERPERRSELMLVENFR